MIKIDLITGFLGSGKTTFLRRYARFLTESGVRVGILENDYGAVNVDVMLLQELEDMGCGIESVAGACDADCHRRRFKTKLIALAMSGYDRVLIEPSGIFDVDEFFDSLYEPPLDKWYEIGSVIAIADADLDQGLSEVSQYLLASQAANAGALVLSKTQEATSEQIDGTVEYINSVLQKLSCQRRFDRESVVTKPWDELTGADFARLRDCGCKSEGFVKRFTESEGYRSLYFMNTGLDGEQAAARVKRLFENESCGSVFRVKGFVRGSDGWQELNATKKSLRLSQIEKGQDIIIVIGENLAEGEIRKELEL